MCSENSLYHVGLTRILIADDDEVVRQGVRKMIETVPGFKIVGEARNGRKVIQMAAESAADLVIMEINLPEVNSVEATRPSFSLCRIAMF